MICTRNTISFLWCEEENFVWQNITFSYYYYKWYIISININWLRNTYFIQTFYTFCWNFLLKQKSLKEIVDLICWVDLFQNFWFKFDIAWFVLWSLAQKEVLNLLHTYVVVLTLGTHNPCNRRYLLHISLCLSAT